jgi:hypothetical protein
LAHKHRHAYFVFDINRASNPSHFPKWTSPLSFLTVKHGWYQADSFVCTTTSSTTTGYKITSKVWEHFEQENMGEWWFEVESWVQKRWAQWCPSSWSQWRNRPPDDARRLSRQEGSTRILVLVIVFFYHFCIFSY